MGKNKVDTCPFPARCGLDVGIRSEKFSIPLTESTHINMTFTAEACEHCGRVFSKWVVSDLGELIVKGTSGKDHIRASVNYLSSEVKEIVGNFMKEKGVEDDKNR